jgi:hypothetical protein
LVGDRVHALSNTGCQVAPPFTVFQTPPDAAPM